MDLRNAHIGLAIAVPLMVIGVVIVGPNPSDAEAQLAVWPAVIIGGAVLLWREIREAKRRQSRR